MRIAIASLMAAALCLSGIANADAGTVAAPAASSMKIGVVNFKKIVEASKYGKQEQATFESLKKQMETVLEEKDKALNEMAAKLDDPDYLDSLSADAENELKHKFRVNSQELGQIQNQYYQALSQANSKILQKLSELVAVAANDVAKDLHLDAILSEEGGFYFASQLDVSNSVVAALDKMHDKEQKDETSQR
jgi:outer membrane protein